MRARIRERFVWLVVAIALCEACDDRSHLGVADGAADPLAGDAGAPPALTATESLDPESIGTYGVWPFDPDAGPPVSPPACPAPSDPAFCADCYAWTDQGPDSLGRNVAGEGFGAVSGGDLNDDGYLDLVVGAPFDDDASTSDLGAVFLYLGSEQGFMPWRVLRLDSGLDGLGFRTAVGDLDGDGDADIAAVYTSGGGGIVRFLNHGGGFFEADSSIWIEAAATYDPSSNLLSTAEFGHAVAVGDFDDDGVDDVAIGVADWNSDEGAVLVAYGNWTQQWLRVSDSGATPATDRLGESLVAFPFFGATWPPVLGVGAPGAAGAYLYLVGTSGLLEYGGTATSGFMVPSFGRSIVARGEVVGFGGASSDAELYELGPARALSFGTNDVRPVALMDANGDGRLELFAVEELGPTSVGALLLHYGIDADPMVQTIFTTPDAIPSRVAGDDLGRQTVVNDFDLDGFDDVAFGAMALSSATHAGMVFGYRGIEEPFSSADNDLDFEDAYFLVDQLTPACDRCEALGLEDGEWCPLDVCVENECIELAGCGDGWAPSGPTPAREGCDDRNLADGDSCSSTCEPTAFVIAARERGVDAPGSDRAVAVEGGGAALVVWTAQLAASTEVRARRYTRYAVETDGGEDATPIVVATMPGSGWDPQPAVAGLAAGGWIVAWTQPAGSELGTVASRTVALDGSLSPATRVSAPTEIYGRDPAILSFAEGTGVLWTDASDPLAPQVMLRLFIGASSEPGAPLDAQPGVGPRAAVGSGGALIVWVQPGELGERSRIVGLRMADGPLDAEPFEIGSGIGPISIAAQGLEYVVAWTGHDEDPAGDIYVRRIPAMGDPVVNAPTRVTGLVGGTPHEERRPSVALRANGWIVGWEEPTERRVQLAAEGGLPSEYAAYLAAELTDGLQRDVALAGSARGTWVVWSDTRIDLSPPAARSTRGFVLHPN